MFLFYILCRSVMLHLAMALQSSAPVFLFIDTVIIKTNLIGCELLCEVNLLGYKSVLVWRLLILVEWRLQSPSICWLVSELFLPTMSISCLDLTTMYWQLTQLVFEMLWALKMSNTLVQEVLIGIFCYIIWSQFVSAVHTSHGLGTNCCGFEDCVIIYV